MTGAEKRKILDRFMEYLSDEALTEDAYEAYRINAPIEQLRVPDEVMAWSSRPDKILWDEYDERRIEIAREIKGAYRWIREIYASALDMAPYLIVEPHGAIQDSPGTISDYKAAKKRLKDLDEIKRLFMEFWYQFRNDMSSIGWWADKFPMAFRIPPGVKEWRPE